MRSVGLSTGCFYKLGKSFSETAEQIMLAGADAIEINLLQPEELLNFNPEETEEITQEFDYVSIHAPAKNVSYGSGETREVVNTLKTIVDELEFNRLESIPLVIHPNIVEDFEYLYRSELYFVLENMDSFKKTGHDAGFFVDKRINGGFDFVFDANHAYRLDPSMELGRQILEAMNGNLAHIHFSGYNGGSHDLAYQEPERADAMLKLIRETDVPVIIESVSDKSVDELRHELDYVRNALDNV